MRIIPKKTKVKNTIWKMYSLLDIIIAVICLGIDLVLFFKGLYVVAIILLIFILIMFLPINDELFYTFFIDNVKYLFSKKTFNGSNKDEIDRLYNIKEITNNGTIVYNDSSLSKVIKVGQKNFGIEDVEEQDNDIMYFASAIKQLEINNTMDIVKIDRPVNFDSFSQDLFNRINENKNAIKNEQNKIKSHILKERIDHIDQLNNIFKQYSSDYYIVIYGSEDIEEVTTNVTTEINKCGIDTKILDKKEVLVFLKYNNYHQFDEREINNLTDEKLLDWIKPRNIKFFSNHFIIDDLEATNYTISDYPLKVKNAWGNNLFNIPNTKVVLKIKPVDKSKALKRIDNCISDLETKEIISDKTSDIKSANLHKETMIKLLNSIQADNESLLDVNITITAYNYLKDNRYKRCVRQILNNDNFKINSMYCKQKDAFLASNISPYNYKKYERSINSMSLAASFPFIRSYIMDENGVLLGRNRNNFYPFIFNIWKRSNFYHNSNAMIIGKSGSGKSFFLKNLIVNEWSNGTRLFICDPEAEYVHLTKNLKGDIIDVGNALEGKINPFHVYQILTDDGKIADSNVTFNAHLKMLESFFKIVLKDASSVTIELINNLIIDAYKIKGITGKTKFNKLKPKDYPLFTDLINVVEDKIKNKEYKEDDLLLVKLYLQKFVNGRYSDIWNHPSTIEVNCNITNFNFQSLFANKNNVIANAQMLLIFRFIEQEIINAKDDKRGFNTMIICDEAHLFIDSKFPIALDFFYQMNKRIRKYNGSFIPATQNISDWNGNEELRHKTSTILKNSQYLFIFKLSSPDMKDVIDVYKIGKSFNEEEQKVITTLGTGECFFVGSSEKRCILKIEAGEYVKNIFTKGEKKVEN